jgi:hypothetical protein
MVWLAIWEDADGSESVDDNRPSGVLQVVRRTAEKVLSNDPHVSDMVWMTIREWAASGAKRG